MEKAQSLGNSALSNLEANSILLFLQFYSVHCTANISEFKKKMDQKRGI